MTSTIYLDTASKVARAALTGTALPAVSAKLLSHLKLIIKCFDGADIITVDADTMTCVIKPKTAPAGAPALIDISAVFSGAGETAQYVFEWDSADSVALRAHLDVAADPTQPQELRCEVQYELYGNEQRVAFPIYFETSYTRPEDPAPEANEDTSWEWLKAKIAAGDNLTRTVNEDTKVITLSVPEFADGREIELQASGTHLQWRYVGEASWTDLVALSAITGPAGADGADGADSTVPGPQGEDGSEIELQASGTHIQWRYVGAMSWTDLIALSAITGPAGADGADALPVASQAEAEAGTANDKSMTPLRTAEAIAALAGGGGGGKVLQVVFAAKTDPANGVGPAWTVTGPSVTITPTASDSRILIFAAISLIGHLGTSVFAVARVAKAGVPLLTGDAAGSRLQAHAVAPGFAAQNFLNTVTMLAQDLPGSTSPQTYDVECSASGTGPWYLNRSLSDTNAGNQPRAASSIIAVEIAA